MAKGIKIGVGGIKTSKKIWVGVGGVARKVKKIFVGVAGAVKLAFSGEISYIGKAQNLSKHLTAGYSAVASNSNYILFATGLDGSTIYNHVEGYDTSLVKPTVPTLSYARYSLKGVTINDKAVFGPGRFSQTGIEQRYDYYDSSLVRGSVIGGHAAWSYATASLGNFGIFAGGKEYDDNTATSQATSINSSMTYGFLESLQAARANRVEGAKVGNYMVIMGGEIGKNLVDVYNSSGVHSIATPPTLERLHATIGNNGRYALAMGTYSTGITSGDAYDSSLVLHSGLLTFPFNFDSTRRFGVVISTDDYLFHSTGGTAVNPASAESFIVDNSLVVTMLQSLPQGKIRALGGLCGNKILIAGGNDGANSRTVDVYEI